MGLVEQRSTTDSSVTQPIGRVAGSYRHSFAPKAYGEELVELLPDLQQGRELRINSATTVVAPLFKSLALKASYVVNFNNPEPGRRKTDRFLTTGLQLSFSSERPLPCNRGRRMTITPNGHDAMALSATQLKHFEKRLLEERASLQRELQRYAGAEAADGSTRSSPAT